MQLIGLLLLWSVRALNGERPCPPLLRYEHDTGALSHEKVSGIQRRGCFKAGAVRVSGIGGCVPAEMVGKLRQGDGHGLPVCIDGNVDDIICFPRLVVACIHDTDDSGVCAVGGIPRHLAVQAYFRQSVPVRTAGATDGRMPAAEMYHEPEEIGRAHV